jgi:hypothetical protein
MTAIANDVGSFRLTLAVGAAILAAGSGGAVAAGMRTLVFGFLIFHVMSPSFRISDIAR